MTPEAERVLCQAFDDMRARLAQVTDELHFNHGEAERWRKAGEELAQELGRAVSANAVVVAERCAALELVPTWRARPKVAGLYVVAFERETFLAVHAVPQRHLDRIEDVILSLPSKPRAFFGPLPEPPEEIGNHSERRDDDDRARTDTGTDARADRARDDTGTDARAEPDPTALLDPERGRSGPDDSAARRADDPVAT